MLRLLLRLGCCTLSLFAQAEESARVLPDTNQLLQSGLTHFLQTHQRQQEVQNLQADGDPFIALYLEERTGKPQGGVLILPDIGQHAQWPEVVAPLREALPDYGWASLTPSLAAPPWRDNRTEHRATTTDATDEAVTAQTTDDANPTVGAVQNPASAGDTGQQNAAESAKESGAEPSLPRLNRLPPLPNNETQPANTESVKNAALAYQQQMLGRIEASVQALRAKGLLNLVLVGNGEHAVWAALWLASAYPDNDIPAGIGLILIDATEDAYAPEKLANLLPKLSLPILDLVTPFNRNAAFTNKERAGAIRHSKNPDYLQVHLETIRLEDNDSNAVTRWVRGWLRVHAAGSEKTLTP